MERVTPGYNNKQNWGSLQKLEFPPLRDPQYATVGKIAHTYVAVVCVCVGPKFPAHYVERMQSMVRRHLHVPHDFHCITDREDFNETIIRLPNRRSEMKGWYSKINLFDPQHFEEGTRVLYFDLDVVIKNDISKFAACHEPFIMIREFSPTPVSAFNSSVMSWTVCDRTSNLYDMPADWVERSWGDQECIWKMRGNEGIHAWPLDWVQSYKYHGRGGEPTAPIVVFHGDPKPDACMGHQWVSANWR